LDLKLIQKIQISVSNDGLKAFMELFNDPATTLSDIARELQVEGIVYGIRSGAIREALLKKEYNKKILIAEGKPAENGKDGYIEYLVNLTPPPQVQVTDKNINYFPVCITNVFEGQKIVKLTPPTPGIPGITVRGLELPTKPGRPLRNVRGLNTKFSDTNANYLIAEKNGNLRYDNGKACVDPEYRINGDLGLINGDIYFCGSLYVSGNIHPGITIRVDGKIEIGGYVEDSVIEAGGNINIASGFVGYGKGKIKSKGDVYVNHILNQTITTIGNIYIKKEAVNSNLSATSIFAQNASIFGGTIFAQDIIKVLDLGRAEHSTTKINLGGRTQKLDIISQVDNEIREKESKVTSLKEKMYQLIIRKANSGSLTEEEEMDLNLMRKESDILPPKLKMLREERDKLVSNLEKNKNPQVIVEGVIYPNIFINIREARLQISNKETNIIFYEKNGSIWKSKSML
jgi:uncharacterized protein